jgi:nucleotide-binding universal stress UspA family protein
MFKKILVPLDGSKRAEAILVHVVPLAKASEAELILLQVISPGSPEFIEPMGPFGAPMAMEPYFEALESAEKEAAAYMESSVGALKKQGVQARSRILRGEAVRSILQVAGEEDADLVAMASQGRTGWARVFYGSVANGVLHQIDRPLLLIRAEGGD